MARRAPRSEAITVAELLVRSTTEGRPGTPPRHREKPPGLARLRVVSVVAGALALTGGVAAAVSMPVERSAGAAWPPVGLEPVSAPLVPLHGDVVIPPAKPAPESVVPSVEPGGIMPAAVVKDSNSGPTPAHRGKLAKAVKIVGKAKPKPKPSPKKAAPVRHAIPDVPSWSRGHHDGGHHHGCGGGGRHRR
ncbi:hypothetical protein [Amycolatopsis sp. NBRC 101858]|uniref:hypothetical protein n=1 Tax=Amycolatopsis sp. NBRC 101858 TaxID=3032200 RepID=UPI00255770C1|nr:hypothetical protein [Amycolatopsis sp. NBRC 101858]